MSATIVGPFAPHEVESISHALGRGQLQSVFCPTPDDARPALRAGAVPRAVFIHGDMEGAETFIAWLRGEAKLFGVPAIMVVRHVTYRAFEDAHKAGADDVIELSDLGSFTRRAAILVDFDPSRRPDPKHARVIVAHPNTARRSILGRGMRLAGFDVSFAANPEELFAVAKSGEPPDLLVTATSFADKQIMRLITELRAELPGAPISAVVFAREAELTQMTMAAEQMQAIEVAAENAPPDNLLFLANELLLPRTKNVRQSPRYLFSMLTAFRPQGELRPVYGYSYNVSREGLFLRTFDPPPTGERVWVEIVPPDNARAVHLRARVIWRLTLTGTQGSATPPGFGVRIEDDACPVEDLESYRSGYDSMRSRQRLSDPG